MYELDNGHDRARVRLLINVTFAVQIYVLYGLSPSNALLEPTNHLEQVHQVYDESH